MHGCTCRYTAAEKVGILLWKLMGIKYLSGWVQMCLIQIVIFLFAASLSLMNDWSQRSAMINGSTLAPLHALLILLLYYPYNPAGCFALCTHTHSRTRAGSHVYLCKHTRCIMVQERWSFSLSKWEDKYGISSAQNGSVCVIKCFVWSVCWTSATNNLIEISHSVYVKWKSFFTSKLATPKETSLSANRAHLRNLTTSL